MSWVKVEKIRKTIEDEDQVHVHFWGSETGKDGQSTYSLTFGIDEDINIKVGMVVEV